MKSLEDCVAVDLKLYYILQMMWEIEMHISRYV